MARTCPAPAMLEVLLLGRFPPDEVDRLAEHVEDCAHCIATLQSLRTRDDLVNAIQVLSAPPGEISIELVGGLIERLCAQVTLSGDADASHPLLQPAESAGPHPMQEMYTFLAPAQRADEIGRLGSYRVLNVLGVGGMGVVFQADDPGLGRRVAIKVLRPRLLDRADARQRFLREAQAAAGLAHDHIVPILHIGEEQGVPFLVMPLLAGETLDERLRRQSRPSTAEVVRIGRDIALRLAAAHERTSVWWHRRPSRRASRSALYSPSKSRSIHSRRRIAEPSA